MCCRRDNTTADAILVADAKLRREVFCDEFAVLLLVTLIYNGFNRQEFYLHKKETVNTLDLCVCARPSYIFKKGNTNMMLTLSCGSTLI